MPVRIKVGDQILEAPDGLSPKNLVLWVRSNIPLQEPTTFSEGFHKKLKDEPVAGGAVGFVEGMPSGVHNAVVRAVPGIVSAAIGTAKGTVNLVKDPIGTLTEAYNTVKASGGKGAAILQQALDLASKDPEAFGRQVGELTGGLEAGIVGSKAVPLLPSKAARVVGTTMEQVGKKGAWPIRMMGAHQLGSGNPMGIATMMVPEGLQKGGAALREFAGGGPLDTLPSGSRNIDVGKIPSGSIRVAPPTAPSTDTVPYGHGEVPPLTIRERMEMDPNLDRLRRRGDAPPAVTAPKTPNQPPEPPTGAAAALPDTPPSPLPGDTVAHMGGKAAEMGDAAVTDMRAAGMNVPKSGIQSTRDIDAMVAGPQPAIRLQQPGGYERLMAETKVPDDLRVVPGGGAPTSATPTSTQPDLMDQFLATQGPKQSFVQPGVGEMTMDASGSHVAAPATRATVAVPDEWLDAVANAARGSKSKSKSFLASGLSANDVQQATSIYRADPTINPEVAAQQLEMLRAGRHMNHYTNAQLSALERQMLDREPDE